MAMCLDEKVQGSRELPLSLHSLCLDIIVKNYDVVTTSDDSVDVAMPMGTGIILK